MNQSGLGINEVPIIAHKGEVVGWPNQMKEAFGGGVNVTYAPSYNVEGSGPEIDALRAEIARDRAETPHRIIEAVQRAKSRRMI